MEADAPTWGAKARGARLNKRVFPLSHSALHPEADNLRPRSVPDHRVRRLVSSVTGESVRSTPL